MSDVFKDISNIWDRLFDHKGFLSGKRGDNEVDNLFKTIENLTDIKDTHINQLKDNVNESVIESNRQLSEALQVCNNLSKLQDESNQNKLLDENINKRKLALDKFIDDITTEYSQINTEHEKQEANLRKVYEELEKKIDLSMSMNVGQIANPHIFVIPSVKLKKYISNIKICDDLPMGIKNIVFKNKTSEESTAKTLKLDYLVTEQDKRFINSLVNNKDYNLDINIEECKIKKNTTEGPKLSVHDLYWLYKYIEGENKNNNHKVYLHELIEESEIVLPKNEEIPRNEELEKRCKKLKEQQQNKEYRDMTKNVDNVRKQHPEDTISYQMKKMNQHLIAIIQFIITLAAAFAFGFIGIELLVGTLDFGFRLLLGIICALIVGIAELYFLAKTLNEDLEFDYSSRPEKEMN